VCLVSFLLVQVARSPDVKARLASLVSEREESRRRSAQLERQLQESVSSMRRELDQYSALAEDVARFERQLADRAEMKASETARAEKLTAMRAERQRLAEEVKTMQDNVARNEKIDVDIKANLEYRERERAIVAHQKKVGAVRCKGSGGDVGLRGRRRSDIACARRVF